MARAIFTQQAMAIGRLFTIVSNVTDPDAYFIGGGVVETTPEMRKWFVDLTTEHTMLREEQRRVASFAEVPDLDMAGARGAALAAWDHLTRPLGSAAHARRMWSSPALAASPCAGGCTGRRRTPAPRPRS